MQREVFTKHPKENENHTYIFCGLHFQSKKLRTYSFRCIWRMTNVPCLQLPYVDTYTTKTTTLMRVIFEKLFISTVAHDTTTQQRNRNFTSSSLFPHISDGDGGVAVPSLFCFQTTHDRPVYYKLEIISLREP